MSDDNQSAVEDPTLAPTAVLDPPDPATPDPDPVDLAVDENAVKFDPNDSIWDAVFGMLNLSDVQSHIESLDHFVNTTDEIYRRKTLCVAKSVADLWRSLLDMYKFGYTEGDDQYIRVFTQVGEYFKMVMDRDTSNAILAFGWFARQKYEFTPEGEVEPKLIQGSELMAKMIQKGFFKMSVVHQFKEISSNLLDPKTNKIENPIIRSYVIGNHQLGKFVFDKAADDFRDGKY